MRTSGTTIRGIRSPILKRGDDLAEICVEKLLETAKNENFLIENQDILGITEAVLAITQGNYATIENITTDICEKFKNSRIGLVFPILLESK